MKTLFERMSEIARQGAPVCRECGEPSPNGDPCERCVEVERILNMTDDEIIAESTDEELGWARGYSEGLRLGMRLAERTAALTREQERAAIVAWLREVWPSAPDGYEASAQARRDAEIADAIERADHLKGKS